MSSEHADTPDTEAPDASAPGAGSAPDEGTRSEASPPDAETGAAAKRATGPAAEDDRAADKPRATSGRPTAGERLAAARAAKAARKAAERGRTAEAVEHKVEMRVADVSGWLRQRTKLLLGVAGGLLLLVVGLALWSSYRGRAAAAASVALWDAVDTARTPLADEVPPDEADADEGFDTAQARAEAALEGFDAVIADHAGTPAAAWAHLGAGSAALEVGKPDDARTHFERALEGRGDDSIVAWRALEGLVLAYEAKGDFDEALARVERLGEIDGGAFARVAEYHAARLRLAKGDVDGAREGLRSLLDELRPTGGLEMAEGSGELPYVRREAQRLLDALGGAPSDDAAESIRRALDQLQGAGAGGE